MSSQPSRRQYDTLKHSLSPRLPASDEYPLPMDTPRLSRGGDSWRPNEHQSPSIDEFSFRNNNTAPRYPGKDNQPIPSRHPTTQDRYYPSWENRDKRRHGGSQRAAKRYGVYKGPQWGNYHRIATAARPLLSLKQEGAQEQMLGTADNVNATKRFLSVDEMSDSGDEQMEESESDTDLGSSEAIVFVESKMNSATEKEANNDAEPPKKRRVIEATTTEHRWSNPDPYTSLPPVDDSLRKKRDVVKIIRKARIPTDRAVNTSDQAAANDDFISLGFEDSSKVKNVGQSSNRVTGDLKGGGLAIPDVPSRVKEFSHLVNLRKDDFPKAPGTQDFSLQANQLGPPPSLEKAEKGSPGEMNSDKRTILDHDGALGNRKRTHDDVIKSTIQRPPKPRKGYSETSQGHLVDQWVPRDGADPTPWHDGKASVQSDGMGFR